MHLARKLLRAPLAFGVMVVWLLATFATDIHLATAQHMVCPEHGEIVDGRQSARSADRQDEERVSTLSAAPADAHHDGCSLPPLGSVTPPDSVLLELPAAVPTALPVATPRSGRWARCALSFAPKTSPPRA
ncbi:MAG: hypothetical protein Q7U06_00690 [Pseudomonadota bacterium]|nr:hypothetical protein [Pseudomonadota bacterium]